jgi:putative membrane protein
MVGYLVTVLATALSLLIVDIVVPGVDIANFPSAIIAAIAIGLVNAFIRPIVQVLSLPINFVTLGAFSFVVNGLLLWLTSVFVPGFTMNGIVAFIFAPIVLSFSSTFLNKYFAEKSIG